MVGNEGVAVQKKLIFCTKFFWARFGGWEGGVRRRHWSSKSGSNVTRRCQEDTFVHKRLNDACFPLSFLDT